MERGRRARQEEDKLLRRRQLMAAAWGLFAGTAYADVTIAAVAARAGVAKGTLFLYFRTKESLFLAIAEKRLAAWFADLDDRLGELVRAGPPGPERVAAELCDSLERHPGLTRLLAVLHGVLERNIDFATALAFKQGLLAQVTGTGRLLERCCPFLGPGQGAARLLRVHALVIGLQQMADPAPVVRDVLREPGMQTLGISFGPTLRDTLAALLVGLDHRQQPAGEQPGYQQRSTP